MRPKLPQRPPKFYAVKLAGDRESPILGIGRTAEEAYEDARGPGAGPTYHYEYDVMPCTEALYEAVTADGGDVEWCRWGNLLMLAGEESPGARGWLGKIAAGLSGLWGPT